MKLLRLQSRDIEKIINILELQPWSISTAINPRMLEAIKFYDKLPILQNVHVVLDNGNGYYVNNYVNWNTYNTVYDDIFFTNRVNKARRYKRVCSGG